MPVLDNSLITSIHLDVNIWVYVRAFSARYSSASILAAEASLVTWPAWVADGSADPNSLELAPTAVAHP